MAYTLRGMDKMDDKARMVELLNFVKIQVEDEKDTLALMSNISAFIMSFTRELNWAGFYLLKDGELVLGPFQGLPACTRLSLDKGVCAKAFNDKKITKVDDVHEFADHIACDSASESELVIPLFRDGKVFGVLDLDSPKKNRFTSLEVETFDQLARLIEKNL